MVRRFAVVVWWIGALFFGGGTIGAIAALLFSEGARIESAGLTLGYCYVMGIVAWTLTYILGGSFRTPPRVE